jgi:uncharacterized membrane protein YadS
MNKIDWSSLWKNEDWLACWVGWAFLVLAILGILPHTPKIGTWTNLAEAFPKGIGTLWDSIILFIVAIIFTLIGIYFLKKDIKRYIPGFVVIFLLAFLAIFISNQATIKYWGIPYVLWALIFGLIISNLKLVPGWLKAGIATEFFIKIGLVCMGATILFSVVLEGGAVGMGQALLVVLPVWFFAYWIGRRFGMSERFSSTMATGLSICGVSASIAAGGAVKGNPKETSYLIAWIMVCAVILIIVMPPLAELIGLPTNMAGAWIGGVIDNTGAVVAAGEVIGTKSSIEAAALVKMSQNILIGFAAFFLAVWATLSLERKPTGERPSFMEVWYRFPKFIVGFIVASLVVTFFVQPVIGAEVTSAVESVMKSYRSWFFALCFVCIGLETNFKELVSVGSGKPAIAFWIGQLFNAAWALFIVWVLWSGTFFTPPILPD